MLVTQCENSNLIIVLVTDQFNCERIILAGRKLSNENNGKLLVLNINRPNHTQNPEAIEFLYKVSKDNDATMLVHYSEKPEKYISQCIKENQPMAVITGIPSSKNSILHKLWLRFGNTTFYMADTNGELSKVMITDRIIT